MTATRSEKIGNNIFTKSIFNNPESNQFSYFASFQKIMMNVSVSVGLRHSVGRPEILG